MSDTVFVNSVTLSDADYFNDVNRLHYTLLQDPTAVHFNCDGRLTLTTATPVTTSDVTAATTVYWAPYKGGKISLYDGSANWKTYTCTEKSIAVPATTDTMYDVFMYDNSGTPALEVLAWTNTTTRATALTTQNGVLVKTGATTRRYLGSFLTTGVSGQTEDSLANRYVWNYYNRVLRPMRRLESTDSWSYATATIRQANNAAANQLNFVIGVSEDAVSARVNALWSNNTIGGGCMTGIGLDATNANATGCITAYQAAAVADTPTVNHAFWIGFPGIGKHYVAWLEAGNATGTQTWSGDAGLPLLRQSGIHGELWA